MQMTIDVGYEQVLQLFRQLPPREKTRLFRESALPTMYPHSPKPEIPDEEYYEFLMNFPVVSEEELERILAAKKEVDQCRPVSP